MDTKEGEVVDVTPWLEPRKNWLPRQPRQSRNPPKRVYSVTEVAEMLGVSRRTVFSYLSVDDPDKAKIPPDGWFRLPGGHIRIYEWAVDAVLGKCDP